jgi:hypothetical protein
MSVRSHDRIFTVLLAVLAVWIFIANFFTGALALRAHGDARFLVDTIIGIVYCSFAFIVLAVRVWFPTARKEITIMFNIALLIFFPVGTALAIYGLWKVDKRAPDRDRP